MLMMQEPEKISSIEGKIVVAMANDVMFMI